MAEFRICWKKLNASRKRLEIIPKAWSEDLFLEENFWSPNIFLVSGKGSTCIMSLSQCGVYQDDSIHHTIILQVFDIWKIFMFESLIEFQVGGGVVLTSHKIVLIILLLTLTSRESCHCDSPIDTMNPCNNFSTNFLVSKARETNLLNHVDSLKSRINKKRGFSKFLEISSLSANNSSWVPMKAPTVDRLLL